MKGFKNVNAYIHGKGIINTSIAIENGKIVCVGDCADKITEAFEVSPDAIVLPGFIDQHIHGAGGADTMDGTTKDISTIANAIASEGVTGFLATTMTQSPENILTAMRAVKEYRDNKPSDGAEVLGVHLEGPFISPKHIGAQPKGYLAVPEIEVMDEYIKASGNAVKMVSLAPELDGAEEFIRHLDKQGIIASIGHTDAGYDQVEKSIAWGMKNVTHTFNAQKGLHHREVGTVGAALLFDELTCEAICDCVHLSVPAIKIILKNKPKDKVCLISDAMRAKHLADGEYDLGGQKVIVKNGEARLPDGTLAASTLKMNVAIKNVVTRAGAKFEDAVDCATINPAKNLSLDNIMGTIEQGKLANFAVLNSEYDVMLTVREGNVIYSK